MLALVRGKDPDLFAAIPTLAGAKTASRFMHGNDRQEHKLNINTVNIMQPIKRRTKQEDNLRITIIK